MKGKILIILVLALVLVVSTVFTVSANAERTDFTFTETCDPDYQIEREIFNGQGNYLAKHWTQTRY